MLQVGNVDFDTAAGDDYNFVFAGVADPADVVHMVDHATRRGGTEGLGDEPAAQPTPRATPRRSQPALSATDGAQAGAPSRVLDEPGGLAQRVGAVGALPGEVVVVAAEVAVGRGLLVDRPVQAQLLAERARAQVEVLVDQARRSRARGTFSVPNVSTMTEIGCATPIA